MECKVEGNPLPTVQWFKNDVCIDNSPDYVITYNNGEAVLRFEEVFLEDQAEYCCKAANQLGTDLCSAKLTVERKYFSIFLIGVIKNQNVFYVDKIFKCKILLFLKKIK